MSQRNKNKNALIVGFGDDIPKTPPKISPNTYIISVDGGYELVKQWGLTPNIMIGDLDSLQPKYRKNLALEEIPVQKYPVEKDKTDLELAVDHALSLGISDIIITGAWGGRIDHSLGNIEILYKLGQKNISACIVTEHSQIILVNRCLELQLPVGTTVSFIPLSQVATGVSTEGLYYPLINSQVKKGQTKTISNKTIAPQIKVTTEKGVLLAIVELKNPR